MSRILKIPRTSAQFTAENLIKKGFLKKYIKNRTTYYSAESLQKIKKMLDFKASAYKKNIEDQKEQLGELEKNLKSKQIEADKRSKVVFYEGVENVVSSYMEFINDIPKGETIYNYVSPATEEYNEFREGMKKFIKERIKKKIKVKVICTYCEDAVRLKLTDKGSLRDTRISFKKTPYDFFSEIVMTKDKILSTSYSYQGLFSNIIFDKNIAQMQLAIFELAWEQAKRDTSQIMQTKDVKKIMGKFSGITEY